MVMGRRRGRPRKDANKSAVKEIEIERVKRAYVKRKNIPPPTPADDEDTITFEGAPFQNHVKKVKTKIGERRNIRTKRRDEDEEYVVKVKRVCVKNKRTKAPAPTKDDDDDTIKNEDIDLGRVSIKVEVTGELDFSSIGAQLDLAPGPELKAIIKSETIDGDGSLLSTMKRKYTKRTEEEKKKKKSEWSCKICNKHLVTKAGMAVHMQNHYVEQLQNPAGIAELPTLSDDAKNTTVDSTDLFTFSDNLMNLVKRQDRDVEQKPYKCPICDKILASNGALINHTRLHTGSAQEFKCDECGKTFRTKGNMRTHSLIHTRGEDGSERQYACPICDKRYKNGSSLYSHSLMAHGAKTVLKRHNCIKCAEAFRFKSELETHMDTSHPDARPYTCQLCEASFTTESKLQCHLKNSHREGSAVNGTICFDEVPADTIPHLDLSILSSLLSCAKVEEDVKGVNKYCCPLCNKFLMSSKGLRIHLLTHTDAKKEFACKDCNKRFRTKYILKAHSLIHTRKYAGERQYACLLCHKKYKNRSSLYSHSLLEHAEAMTMKRHRCLVCSQTFRSKTALETHTETRHPGEKPYACTKCKATFQKDSTLRGHLKEVHMELCSLLLCNTCGKQFKRAGQLKDHERVHTGEKPFICMLCGFKYHFSWELRNHEKRHVIGAADKLVCQVCGATFSSQWSHDTHVRRAHGNGTQRLRRTGERPLRWRWYDCPKCGERIGRSKEFCAHMGKHRLAEMRAARENRVPGPTKRRIRSEAQKIVERERNKLYRERKRARRLGLPKPPSPEGEPRAKRRNNVNGNGVTKRVRNRKRAVANGETTEGSNAKRLISVKVKDEVAMEEEMPNNFSELTDEHSGVSYSKSDGHAPARASMSAAAPYDRQQWNNSNSRSVARNIGQSTSLVHSEDNLHVQWQTWGNMPTHIMNSIYSQMSDTHVVGAGGDMSRNYNRNERQPQLVNNSIYITGVHVNKAKSRHNFRTTRKFRRGLRARKMLRKYARLRGDSARARIVIDAVLGPHRILNYSYRHYWGCRPEKLTPKNVFLPVPPLFAWQKNFL